MRLPNPETQRCRIMCLAAGLLSCACSISCSRSHSYQVASMSMAPTLQSGDVVTITRKDAYQRGDVVVFAYPEHPDKTFIMRIIGLPGESIRLTTNSVIINGVTQNLAALGMPFLEHQALTSGVYGVSLPYRLRSSEYFVLGDNPAYANDSRFWAGLEETLILGEAVKEGFRSRLQIQELKGINGPLP